MTAHLSGRIDGALASAQAAVLSRQSDDGSWAGVNQAGPFGTAFTLAFTRYLGALSSDDARDGVRYLRGQQRPDGSTPPWAFATHGDVNATAIWYAGMFAAGIDEDDPAMRRAREWIDASGGFDATLIFAKLALVVAGVLPASTLPRVSLAYKWVPGHERVLARVFGVASLLALHYVPPLVAGLRASGDPGRRRGRERQACIDYLTARQDPSGGFAGVGAMTLLSAAALVALGVPRHDPRVVRAVAFGEHLRHHREDGLYVAPFRCALWDTAQLVRGLMASGLPATHPALESAAAFLARHQTTRPPPWDWQTPPPGVPTTGGWPFQVGNELNPDLDSSQEVLGSLALFRAAHPRPDRAVVAAVDRGLAFQLGMQNPDGGWAAFSYGKRGPRPGPMFRIRPPARRGALRMVDAADDLRQKLVELGDPSTADVTGRTLLSLGLLGFHARRPEVRRAIALIDRQRDPATGVWWGMWAVNYLPTTSYILTGLAAVGADLRAPPVRHAVSWMLAHQNDDGGWGEGTDSYVDPDRAGRGASMRSITAFVLWALTATGDAARAEAARGVEYLLAHQGKDGLWADEQNQGVLMPHIGYYYNTTFSTYVALEALGAYRAGAGR